MEKYQQHQQDLYHVFIDFKKAFDRVWHAALWTTMHKYNIGANLITSSKACMKKPQAQYSTKETLETGSVQL